MAETTHESRLAPPALAHSVEPVVDRELTHTAQEVYTHERAAAVPAEHDADAGSEPAIHTTAPRHSATDAAISEHKHSATDAAVSEHKHTGYHEGKHADSHPVGEQKSVDGDDLLGTATLGHTATATSVDAPVAEARASDAQANQGDLLAWFAAEAPAAPPVWSQFDKELIERVRVGIENYEFDDAAASYARLNSRKRPDGAIAADLAAWAEQLGLVADSQTVTAFVDAKFGGTIELDDWLDYVGDAQ